MGLDLGLGWGAEEVPDVAVLVVEGRVCLRRKFPDRAVEAVDFPERQLLLLQLATPGGPIAPLQYPLVDQYAGLVFANGVHLLSAKTADPVLAHEQ